MYPMAVLFMLATAFPLRGPQISRDGRQSQAGAGGEHAQDAGGAIERAARAGLMLATFFEEVLRA